MVTRRRPVRAAALRFGYLVLLAVLLVAPLDLHVPNAPRLREQEGLAFTRPGIARSPIAPRRLREALAESGQFSLELWAETYGLDEHGPARLVSYSAGIGEQNFTIGQDRNALVVRLRTGPMDVNGTNREVRLDNAFRLGRPLHIVVTYDSARLVVHIDGQSTDRRPVDGRSADRGRPVQLEPVASPWSWETRPRATVRGGAASSSSPPMMSH